MVAETAVANGPSDGNLAGKLSHTLCFWRSYITRCSPCDIIIATYALIYSFLSTRSHEKAAAAVKKAVKDIVVLKDNVVVDGPSLDEIVRWWKVKKEADALVKPTSFTFRSYTDRSVCSKDQSSSDSDCKNPHLPCVISCCDSNAASSDSDSSTSSCMYCFSGSFLASDLWGVS